MSKWGIYKKVVYGVKPSATDVLTIFGNNNM